VDATECNQRAACDATLTSCGTRACEALEQVN